MRNQDCQPIIRTLLEHHAEGRSWRTAPTGALAEHYTDRAWLAFEQATLFTDLPRVAALTPDLALGSFLTLDTFGLPLVLTRDEDGAIAGFVNACAHRGTQVVSEARGCSRRLTCPYHAWTYDLGGRLRGVPDAASFPDVEVGGPGLVRVPTVEDHGLIWVLPQVPGPEDPVALTPPDLGGIADDLDTFDIEAHRHWRSHRFDLAMNWKLVVDSFLEPYHFASLHRNTVGPIFMHNLSHAQRFGPHVREVLPRWSLTELADQPPDTWDIVPYSALVYVLFPSTVIIVQVDHLETWRISPDPDDPGRSVCDLDFYIPDVPATEKSERHWERSWRLTIDTVVEEDFAALATSQTTLETGAVRALRFGANEPALGMFHASLSEAAAKAATNLSAAGADAMAGPLGGFGT